MSVNCQVGVFLASDVEELNIAGLRCADNLSTNKKKTAKKAESCILSRLVTNNGSFLRITVVSFLFFFVTTCCGSRT